MRIPAHGGKTSKRQNFRDGTKEHAPFAKTLALGRLSDRGGPFPRAVAEPTL
jgi:hypothetical protein